MDVQKNTFQRYTTGTAAFLVVCVTLLVYLPALKNGFVNFDDHIYVYENPAIRSLDIEFLKWAFSNSDVGHWHPATWFSLAIDHAFWGQSSWGFHLTNIILHSLNTSLVFILVLSLKVSDSRGPGVNVAQFNTWRFADLPLRTTNHELRTIVAALITAILFGIHPMHVESVAWVTERKDVLCSFFFLLATLTYIKYISSSAPKKFVFYCSSLIFFIIALLSKPMALSLPIVLLILDFYPFRRFEKEAIWIFIEKIPFFLLSLVSSIITIWAAGTAGAMGEIFSFTTRLFISARGYMFYLGKMIFPSNLAPFYPYPEKVDIFNVEYLGAAILFLSITICCLWSLRRGRLIFAVWLYYVIMLIPVIGIVHAGPQDTADRYTYLPSIGPFLLIGLAIGNLLERCTKRRLFITMLLLFLSGILTFKTFKQIKVWHDSITLWSYDIKLFPNTSFHAYIGRGTEYGRLGKYKNAIKDFDMAIKINPAYPEFYYNRGITFEKLGETLSAIKDYEKAVKDDPQFKEAYYRLGSIYTALGNMEQARINYKKAADLGLKDAQDIIARSLPPFQ